MTHTKSSAPEIPGYGFGLPGTACSPVSNEDLRQLEETIGWSTADEAVMWRYAGLFREHAEQMVDTWRAVIGSQPHLARWFVASDGRPDEEYKARVKQRFVQWVIDVATRPHDRAWLNYQEEIGLRHTPAAKNRTDGSHTPTLVPLRYLLAFIPIVTNIRRILESEISNGDGLRALELAWTKAVHLHIALWARPYTRDGLW